LLVDRSDGDKVVTQPAAVLGAARQRRAYIRFRHALGPDKQVT
jgi:hypothetical protein